MFGLGRRTGGNWHIPSSALPTRQQAEKRKVLLEWILHCGSTFLYPTLLELHMLTDKQITLVRFFMQNNITAERGQWCIASCYMCLALQTHVAWPLGVQFILRWEGGRANRDRKCKMGQCPQQAARRVQTGWDEKTYRRESQPQSRLLGRLWKFCLWGFYGSAEEAKLSLIWSGESPELEGDHWASGSSPSNIFLDRVKK